MKSIFTFLMMALMLVVPAMAQDPATPPAETPAAAEAPAPPNTFEQDATAYFDNGAPSGPLAGKIGPGHNAWMMTSSALVLFMTLPGLALFYGGLVRRKNVLSVMAQCMGIAGLVSLLWWAIGYSLCFGAGSKFFGDGSMAFLNGIKASETGMGGPWISNAVWVIFQLTFAIITPALIVGAIAERMKFISVLVFVTLWMFAVYFPLAHMVWGGGFMAGAKGTIKAIDFAGGTVVHMSSGFTALALCIILGKRRGYPKEPMPPHNLVLCMVGTGMLWVGWYGFNAGSAVASDGIAANAFATTTFTAAIAGFVWAMLEWILKGKPSVLGFCSGIVAGLVVITPAAGFVSISASVAMGIFAGLVPFLAVAYLKKKLGYDDALDTFGVHGVGGALGAILTGIFASPEVNGGVEAVKDGLIGEQIKAVGVTIVWSVIATVVIATIVKVTVGLRPSEEVEVNGLDLAEHGEEGYHHAA